MHSLRTRLVAFLLLAVGCTALVIGVLGYRQLLRENEELFDYQLRQLALSLRDQGAIPPPLMNVDPANDSPDTIIQIWDFEGSVVYISRPGVILPTQARLGFSDLLLGNQRWRCYSIAMHDRVIQVAQPLKVRQELAAAAALRSLAPLLAFVPLMAVLTWWLVGNSLSPLYRLADEVKQRGAATLEPVLEDGLPSEIAPVVKALNALLARLKRSFEKERAFVADAAHELRSPLTALKLQLQLYGRARSDIERAEAVAQLNAAVDRATHLVEQLLALARSDPGNDPADNPNRAVPAMDRVNLSETARQAAAETFSLAQHRNMRLSLDAPADVSIRGNAASLGILVRNLIDNAVRYTPENGTVTVSTTSTDGAVELRVDDSGPGIPAAERERVWDRFYRHAQVDAAADQTGSGLGLAIVKNIAEKHGARVELEESPLGGLRAVVRFPFGPNGPAASPSRPQAR